MYEKKYPIFLLGLSLGGLSAYKLALDEPERYKGVILLAPYIMGNSAYKMGKMTVKYFLGYIIPRFGFIQ